MTESRPGVNSCSSASDFLAWIGSRTKLDKDAMGVDTLNHFSFPCLGVSGVVTKEKYLGW